MNFDPLTWFISQKKKEKTIISRAKRSLSTFCRFLLTDKQKAK